MVKVLVTGRPGIGKTTLVTRVTDILKDRGVVVGGMITREIRRNKVRVGFEILDVESGRVGTLAWAGSGGGPRIGKYIVNLRDLDEVGVSSINYAVESCQVVVVDEIGPMELFSDKFKEAVWRAFTSDKCVLATIHIRANKYSFCKKLMALPSIKLFKLDMGNRGFLHRQIAKLIMHSVKLL